MEDINMITVVHLLESAKPALERIAREIRKNAIEIVDEKGLVAWGDMRRAIQTKVVLDDGEPRIEVFIHDSSDKDMKYAQYIHEGIKPHMPPVDDIADWVRKKRLHKNKFLKAWEAAQKTPRKNRIKKADLEEKHITSIAWAIAINMKKKGKEAVPFLDLAIKMTLDEMKSDN